jgi:hypothetical protein
VSFNVSNSSLATAKNLKPEDWVTAEAMGIAMQAIFSLRRSDPWQCKSHALRKRAGCK